MLPMKIGWSNNNCGLANAGFGQLVYRRENRNISINVGEESHGAVMVRLSQRCEFTGSRIASQFMYVKGVNETHPADTGHSDS